jgi:hypothetical protein
MRELTFQERNAVSGAVTGPQSIQLPGGVSLTIDWNSVNAGLTQISTGDSQARAGNIAQGLGNIFTGLGEVFGDISISETATPV